VAVLPFFHIYAMTTIMAYGLKMGAKIVTLPKFEPEAYMAALQKYKVVHIQGLTKQPYKMFP
jgi:acyl-CoA synthetase (AMP-forming)/AMP-acid ligase II